MMTTRLSRRQRTRSSDDDDHHQRSRTRSHHQRHIHNTAAYSGPLILLPLLLLPLLFLLLNKLPVMTIDAFVILRPPSSQKSSFYYNNKRVCFFLDQHDGAVDTPHRSAFSASSSLSQGRAVVASSPSSLLLLRMSSSISSSSNSEINSSDDATATTSDDTPTPTTLTTSSISSMNSSSLSEMMSHDDSSSSSCSSSSSSLQQVFNLSTALLCGGLAFDAYVEPATNSSRWERGSQGLQVAFCSPSYTRNLYQGLVEITIQQCTNLPADAVDVSPTERLLSGQGIDACLLVAVLEGQWQQDVQTMETSMYHTGVLDLTGAAHVSRSTVCWSSINQQTALTNAQKTGKQLPYYVPASFLQRRGAQAVWPESEPPFYLYVQDPTTARLVFTVLDADRLSPETGTAIGSTYRKLCDLIPQAALPPHKLIQQLKDKVVETIQKTGSIDTLDETTLFQLGLSSWQGELKLTSKPRKKSKNAQILAGAAAGAAFAGPVGAAAGAAFGALYEGQVQGSVTVRIRYLPLPREDDLVELKRTTYRVRGGMPGIDWGSLYDKYYAAQRRYLQRPPKPSKSEKEERMDDSDEHATEARQLVNITSVEDDNVLPKNNYLPSNDLEHCFFVNHAKTGATCAVYRSLEKRVIVVSFRGTCVPVDLITDASLVQQAWMEGQDVEDPNIPKVHAGFRTSLNSIARRLKELVLATPAPGEDISNYDMYITGHSLGAALSTLFIADIAQYGIDAGRGLPQTEESEPWWKAITNTFMGQKAMDGSNKAAKKEPPRPKSLHMYNFGSPRVGNHAFAELFDSLLDQGKIQEAYRIVSGEDVVARLPRTMNALIFGNVGYEHVGTTVLIKQPETNSDGSDTTDQAPILWIEGESDNSLCPTRDGVMLSSPMAEGSLLNDLFNATQDSFFAGKSGDKDLSWTERLSSVAGKVTERVKQLKASDLASIVGIDRSFTDREVRMIQSILQGKALAHHLEDEYYAGMGRASGFLARVGEEIVELEKEMTS